MFCHHYFHIGLFSHVIDTKLANHWFSGGRNHWYLNYLQSLNNSMAHNWKADLAHAEQAWAAWNWPSVPPEPIVVDSSDDDEVNNQPSPHPASPSHETETHLDDEDEIEELDGDELLEGWCLQNEHNSHVFKKFEHAYNIIFKPKTKKVWKQSGWGRSLVRFKIHPKFIHPEFTPLCWKFQFYTLNGWISGPMGLTVIELNDCNH